MLESLSSRLSSKLGKSSKHIPTYRHISATTDDITLEFPAEIEYRVDTLPTGTLLPKPTSRTANLPQTAMSKQKSGWMAESGQNWYLGNFSVRAGSIGACGTVSALGTQSELANYPIPSGDLREGHFSGPFTTKQAFGGQVTTKASDPNSFHRTERDFFKHLEEESGNVYRLVNVEMGDYCEDIDPGDQGTLVNTRDVSEIGDRKTATVTKRYSKARWNFRAQLRVPTEGNLPDKKAEE
ncbi:hypothetical protein L198_02625 [Cryptococcus wingfieldii CBS 7118]|uniref:Uncharacterized protein n=1 Tax=Cryptococcus wingfieldii CBS 7118 TaxID=1295528 RepID=A0A1E3JML5_9TREE|nr:hypothetical protein L198_02625 [Cryptococcus wingfieldii CBS 7118]ODO01896.1 hypothetical protein L198_02625 [Cryptococcus wingfieldii CBS 7118]